MRRAPVVWLLSCCLFLLGCTTPAKWTPGPVITEPPTSATPTPGQGGSPSPSGPSTPAPTMPSTAGAINADKWPSAHFASPSGRIWCALYDDSALCHFPRGMDMSAVPSAEKVCPGAEIDVTGVSVITDADYFCSGGAEALPQTNGEYVGWWKGTGLPSVRYDGQKFAVLPYGKKLARKGYVCASERAGVTCGNTATGRGFRIALSGVTFLS